MIQNQHGAGKISKKWDRSGIVLEDMGFNKYRVKVDGSGRITDRNRQFLRKFTPVTPGMPGPTPNTGTQQVDPSPERIRIPQQVDTFPERIQIPQQVDPSPERTRIPQQVDQTPLNPPDVQRAGDMINPGSPSLHSPESPTFETPPSSPVVSPNHPGPVGDQPVLPQETPTLPRRSTRVRRPPDRLKFDKF